MDKTATLERFDEDYNQNSQFVTKECYNTTNKLLEFIPEDFEFPTVIIDDDYEVELRWKGDGYEVIVFIFNTGKCSILINRKEFNVSDNKNSYDIEKQIKEKTEIVERFCRERNINE